MLNNIVLLIVEMQETRKAKLYTVLVPERKWGTIYFWVVVVVLLELISVRKTLPNNKISLSCAGQANPVTALWS
jgi:hypothetical protein